MLRLQLWQHRTACSFTPSLLDVGCELSEAVAFSDFIARKLAGVVLLILRSAKPHCDGCSYYLCLLKMVLVEVGWDF